MQNSWISLGLMSGTSGDGIDASIIKTNGINQYELIKDKYFEYDSDIYKDIHNLKEKIHTMEHLKIYQNEINSLERKITIFHAQIVKQLSLSNDTIIGFHGQTIYHNETEKISRQLGDGKLLSQLSKKNVVYNFRQNDLDHGGRGAPLTPIFHKLLSKNDSRIFLNIGGVSNETTIMSNEKLSGSDIGPGMCLIDKWMRLKTKKNYDTNGSTAKSGKINRNILEKALKKFFTKYHQKNKTVKSFDIKEFDISFVQGLSLEDGAATLTEYTARIIVNYFSTYNKGVKDLHRPVTLTGGGRKNKFLFDRINDLAIHLDSIFSPTPLMFEDIDNYVTDGDFVESQAFAYLAARSNLKLPISFPETTGCKKPVTGGVIIKFK